MATNHGVRTDSLPESPIERLVRERGLRRFGLFFVTGEGEYLPNGDEERSGYVIDAQGQVYSFWTGWDQIQQAVIFSEWEPVSIEAEWSGVAEFERARAAAGLTPTRRAVS
jgi:hypothetical protein